MLWLRFFLFRTFSFNEKYLVQIFENWVRWSKLCKAWYIKFDIRKFLFGSISRFNFQNFTFCSRFLNPLNFHEFESFSQSISPKYAIVFRMLCIDRLKIQLNVKKLFFNYNIAKINDIFWGFRLKTTRIHENLRGSKI